MRLRHIKGCEEFVWNSDSTINNPEDYRGRWKNCDEFKRFKELHIEIGMGKGMFLRRMARLNPDINYLGIEIYESIIQKAIERKEKDEEENGVLDNLHFLCMNAERLPAVFEDGEVDRIYLNFSDPWPKDRHAKRRLTSPVFMKLYDKVLAKDGVVEFKTDNVGLFDYSLESIPESGWKIIYQTRDLHSEDVPNVMTEYEEKFSSKGNPICKLVAKR